MPAIGPAAIFFSDPNVEDLNRSDLVLKPLWLVVLFVALSLSGCFEDSAAERSDRGESPPTAAVVLPQEPPSIRGVVTDAADGTIRVEENPADESGSAKAVVRLSAETEVVYRGGGSAAPAELTLGHNVSVWFTGPVMESYPVQAMAALVVIEPARSP